MRKLLAPIFLMPLLTGCGNFGGSLPVYIPTGNPVTDVLVNAAVEEGARFVASKVAPVVLDTVMNDGGSAYDAAVSFVASLFPVPLFFRKEECRTVHGIKICGDKD